MRTARRLACILALLCLGPLVTLAQAQLLNGQTPLAGKTIPKYTTALPHFAGARIDASAGPLTINMKELSEQILPAGYPQTTVWGYEIVRNGTVVGPAHYPAFTLEAQRGTPLTITYRNLLGNQTLYKPIVAGMPGVLPVDQTVHWAAPLGMSMGNMGPYSGPVPVVPHLHGGEVPSTSDGGPDAWFTPENDPAYPVQLHGPAWGIGGTSNVYTYPNAAEATTQWWHDHALGATRLNVYAGLAGFYFLRDSWDTGKAGNGPNLPYGPYEIELAVQDKMFDTQGRLYFPNLGINPMNHPYWIPEFFGDVMMVNGVTWPYLNVEPRRYRFHMLDGCNARFLDMDLMNLVTGTRGPSIWQIGTDGGLLDKPVRLDQNAKDAPLHTLFMAPGERADVIIDFSAFAGQTLTLTNSASAPYPKGAPPDPKTVGQIMQFRVGATPVTDNSYNPATYGALRTPLAKLVNFAMGTPAVTADTTRQLTLVEIMGMAGPLEVLVNNTKWVAATSETPTEGNTELWQIINLTADAHPMHFHLVQYQLVSRQPFNTTQYRKAYDLSFPGGLNPADNVNYLPGVFMPGWGPPLGYRAAAATKLLGGNPDVTPYLGGKPRPADANEQGWKDTFKMFPGEVTTVLVRFAPQALATATAKKDLVFPFDPSVGPGYVWHCHIVDHEDNEMMRPMGVQANPLRVAKPVLVAAPAQGETATLPARFKLDGSYPNPFNSSTQIRFELPVETQVTLEVFNELGQEVGTLVSQILPAGVHTVVWDASNRPSGIYFYRLQAGDQTATGRLTLLK